MDDATLGDRIRAVRMRRGLTQKELTAASGVSLSLLKKLESGALTTARPETLRTLAGPLDVTVSSLAAGPDEAPPHDDDVTVWEPVRSAIDGTRAGPPDREPTLAGVEAACGEAVRLVLGSRFAEVRVLLPVLLRDADALTAASGSDRAARAARSRARQLAGFMLGQTWQLAAARYVLALALDDADGDPAAGPAAAAWLAWARLRGGDLDGCAGLASDWADRSEPKLTRAGRDEIAAWGRFQVTLATAAARDNRDADAATALRWARVAAVAVGKDFVPAGNPWDVFGPRTVAMASAEIALVQGDPARALRITERLDSKGFPVTRNWLRSRLDVAAAHVCQGDDEDAVAVLAGVRDAAPEWLAQQRGARDTVAVLAGRPRRVIAAEVRALADAVRLPLL
jgi:transcriptional regulator with XRE-family HTH domain